MGESLIYSTNKTQTDFISQVSSDVIAELTEDFWQVKEMIRLEEFKAYLSANPSLDLACVDVSGEGTIEILEQYRKNNPLFYLLIIADSKMLPTQYIKPSIMATSLLLKPYTRQNARDIIKQLIASYLKLSENSDSFFTVNNKDEGTMRIPTDSIAYFESREKKLFLRVDERELAFYGTLDKLLQALPSHFIRCHRSFIINYNKIKTIHFAENYLELESGDIIPISRSMKSNLKEYKR